MKRTKRGRECDQSQMTLDKLIAEKRSCLVKERLEAPSLLEKAQALRKEAHAKTKRFQHREKLDLLSHADELEHEARERLTMEREHSFETKVVSYLRHYHNHTQADQPASVLWKKKMLIDEFLTTESLAPPKVLFTPKDVCPVCPGEEQLLFCSTRSIMSCPECGYCVTYLDATSSSASFDEVIDYNQYSYKRINHYIMHIANVQGKETFRVAHEDLNKISQDLFFRQGIRQAHDITIDNVRNAIRKLKLRRVYDHAVQATSRLNGITPRRITSDVEEKLKNMFLQMQPAFQRHAPSTRTNFLSYSFTLYRCLQLLNQTQLLSNITLLKGRDKLEANNEIFNKIATDLNWNIFDDIPSNNVI